MALNNEVPRNRNTLRAAKPTGTGQQAPTKESRVEDSMRTLIVEDEFVSRAKLQKILSSYGECHVAINGLEGLNAFLAKRKAIWENK